MMIDLIYLKVGERGDEIKKEGQEYFMQNMTTILTNSIKYIQVIDNSQVNGGTIRRRGYCR